MIWLTKNAPSMFCCSLHLLGNFGGGRWLAAKSWNIQITEQADQPVRLKTRSGKQGIGAVIRFWRLQNSVRPD